MARKYLISFMTLLIGFIGLVSSWARADFSEDYQNFLKLYDNYRVAASNYLTTRNQYLTYGTLTSKNDALTAVKTFLIARDDVLINYFGLLSGRNSDLIYTPVVVDEMNFLNNHKSLVPATGSLEDAVKSSQLVEKRHVASQLLAHKVVATIMLSKVENLRSRSQAIQAGAQQMVNELKNQGKDVTTVERWLLDAKNKDLLAEDKILAAKSGITNLNAYDADTLTRDYNKIQFTIFEGNQYIKETIEYMKELAETLKYGNY